MFESILVFLVTSLLTVIGKMIKNYFDSRFNELNEYIEEIRIENINQQMKHDALVEALDKEFNNGLIQYYIRSLSAKRKEYQFISGELHDKNKKQQDS